MTGRRSSGTYDLRGPACIAALRDVVLYAAGRLSDDAGRAIDDVAPIPVLHDLIGLFGYSNGGNLVMALPALHGADVSRFLRFIVQFESPVSSQFLAADVGGVRFDWPPGRSGGLAAPNPRYAAYGPLEVAIDYGQLFYDPSNPIHEIFRMDPVTAPTPPCSIPPRGVGRPISIATGRWS